MSIFSKVKKSYRAPLIIAALLHLALAALLMVNVSTHQYRWQQSSAPAQPAIVNATAVDSSMLNKQMNKIKSEQMTKQRQELERVRRLEQKALAYKQQRVAEERRLHDAELKQEALKQQQLVAMEALKKQQLAQADALKRQKQQEEQARQKALEWNKKATEMKKKELARQQEKLQADLLAQQIKAEQQQINNTTQQLSQQSTARMEGLLDKYRAQILQAIQNNWHPLVQDSQLSCQLLVYLGPGGVVTAVDLVKSSGDIALDRSARLAILKASPLPVPEDQALFDRFRQFRIKMSPQDIKGMS